MGEFVNGKYEGKITLYSKDTGNTVNMVWKAGDCIDQYIVDKSQ